jgi:hypothetical protein
MCKALLAKDDRAFYELTTPDNRGCTTYETWFEEWRSAGDGRPVACKIVRIRRASRAELVDLQSKCSNDTLLFADGAVVKVKLTLQFPDGTRESIDDMFNGWLNIDGVWYWHDYSAPSLE